MIRPEISIIVPVYKVEKYLNKCIDSILLQTFEDFELILVEDGSPDKCGEICDKYEKEDNRIKVIHKENGGVSSARNAGIAIARGKYINFIDSDDWIERESLETLYKIANETCADIVQGKGVIAKAQVDIELIKNSTFNEYSNVEALHDLFNYDSGEIRIVPFNKLYSIKLFSGLRYPEGKIHEDEYLTPRLIYKANKVVVVDSQLYHYRLSEDSIMRSKFSIKNLDRIYILSEECEFYREIGERELYNKSLKSYGLTLIDMYKKSKKYLDNSLEITNDIKVKFNNNYKIFMRNKEATFKNKVIFTFFRFIPNIIINLF